MLRNILSLSQNSLLFFSVGQVYSDIDTIEKFGRLTQIYADLKDYRLSFIDSNIRKQGLALMRPLFVEFEEDLETFDIQYQYMFGDDLLVAPVTDPNATT